MNPFEMVRPQQTDWMNLYCEAKLRCAIARLTIFTLGESKK
jgi:hypothetical protein